MNDNDKLKCLSEQAELFKNSEDDEEKFADQNCITALLTASKREPNSDTLVKKEKTIITEGNKVAPVTSCTKTSSAIRIRENSSHSISAKDAMTYKTPGIVDSVILNEKGKTILKGGEVASIYSNNTEFSIATCLSHTHGHASISAEHTNFEDDINFSATIDEEEPRENRLLNFETVVFHDGDGDFTNYIENSNYPNPNNFLINPETGLMEEVIGDGNIDTFSY